MSFIFIIVIRPKNCWQAKAVLSVSSHAPCNPPGGCKAGGLVMAGKFVVGKLVMGGNGGNFAAGKLVVAGALVGDV